jgi:hypothetical protein
MAEGMSGSSIHLNPKQKARWAVMLSDFPDPIKPSIEAVVTERSVTLGFGR